MSFSTRCRPLDWEGRLEKEELPGWIEQGLPGYKAWKYVKLTYHLAHVEPV